VVFSDLYGTDMDTELGTADRTQRFTTTLRKRYVNEAQRWFNEQTGCYIKRVAIAISDGTQEYDLEASGVISAQDYIRPSKTSASLKRVGSSTTEYTEGPELPFKSEERLNQERPNWRAESAAVPDCWSLRADGGSTYLVLVPAPDVPAAETWTLLWPYVAQPEAMTDDSHEPYGNASPRTVLRPYHRGILHYAAAQLEKLRKNYEAVERQLKMAAGYVAKFNTDQALPRGTQIRMRTDYRRRLLAREPYNPFR
jgi:hypothetical protein